MYVSGSEVTEALCQERDRQLIRSLASPRIASYIQKQSQEDGSFSVTSNPSVLPSPLIKGAVPWQTPTRTPRKSPLSQQLLALRDKVSPATRLQSAKKAQCVELDEKKDTLPSRSENFISLHAALTSESPLRGDHKNLPPLLDLNRKKLPLLSPYDNRKRKETGEESNSLLEVKKPKTNRKLN